MAPRSHRPGKLANSLESLAISSCGSPAICTILFRLVAPATIDRSRRRSRQARARSRNSASFACPSCAGAVTDALSTRPPSAVATMLSRRSDLPRGDRRIATRRPSSIGVSGPSQGVRGNVEDQQSSEEHKEQDQQCASSGSPVSARPRPARHGQREDSESGETTQGPSGICQLGVEQQSTEQRGANN